MKEKSGYAWWIFGICCLISLVGFGLVINTVGLFYEPMSVAFKVGRTQIALMSTFQSITGAVTLLFAGKVMTKISVKRIVVSCFVIMGAGLVSLAFAKSLAQLYFVSMLIGICQPFAIGLSIPVLLGNWFEKKLGTVMGIALSVSAIGGTIFNPAISSVITSFGWRTGWMVEGGILLITIVPLTMFLLKDKPGKGQEAYGHETPEVGSTDECSKTGITLGEAVRTPMFYLLAFAMISLQFVAGFVQHISGHIVNIGLPLTTGAAVVSGVMLGAAVGKICIGYLLDKCNNRAVIGIFTVFGVIGWSGLLVMRSAFALVASGFILGLGQGILLVAMPYLIRTQFGQKDYSNILSILGVFSAVSAASAVSIDGIFYDLTNSFSVPLLLNVILYILAGLSVVASIMFSRQHGKRIGDVLHAE
ncbi:major facilitator superfamily MFS_1 [Coriobacterium glomerans PW2]|uniref:Major facilitator superfamily MFS_1 n=1 Tax=Coriobacterium glomerans (strain ATCC 49209 / DSM 20642 / JCM 10262 / PW2) TaxID=700015 RepID=F2N923_CORGP|nr:MFS transporter [Coriobacterium glomerans]AEB07699.1 major facilitator superfamily MFS_1 [Coriobacterium glomerans PW2]